MARITLDLKQRDPAPSWLVRFGLAAGRRRYGQDLDTVLAMSHHPGVFFPWALMETAGLRRRSRLPDGLADLVVLVTAVHLGCSWCIDFGAGEWERRGLDQDVVVDAVRWRTADRFDEDARAAFVFAEAASGQLEQVTDDMVADLVDRFGEPGMVELAYLVALENMRSRFNAVLGLTSQGFSSGEVAADSGHDRLRQPRPCVRLAPNPGGAEVVYREPGHHPGEPAAWVVDGVRPLAPPPPAVGHDVLGVGPARGEPVGDAVQVWP
jgi:alkylhydroperoxidase family enzyme